MAGKFEAEYIWAQQHPDIPQAKVLLELAQLYLAHQDEPTYGLILGAVDEIRKIISSESSF